MKKSHPTRVRGLKFFGLVVTQSQCASHPTRVRGLKFYTIYVGYLILTSHPTRVRGLKSLDRALSAARCPVAPYTGAWIEI